MSEERQLSNPDDELIRTLFAISVVAKRLARKLILLADQSQEMEGEKEDERYGRDNQRTPRCRRSY